MPRLRWRFVYTTHFLRLSDAILFACVNALHIFRIVRLRLRIYRVEKLPCHLFGTYDATRKMRQEVAIYTGKFPA